MIKYTVYGLIAVIIIGLIISGVYFLRTSVKNKKEMAKYNGEKIEMQNNLGSVLVVYYSLSGKTKGIAEQIKSKTNADIYEIKTVNVLPSGPQLYLDIKKQIKEGKYPEIQKDIPDFSKYDVIFVGAPVWWYTIATPAMAFLEAADFQNKKVVPFSTQGSNAGAFFEDFKAKAKNADMLNGEKFNNISDKYKDEVDNKITVWLNSLNK